MQFDAEPQPLAKTLEQPSTVGVGAGVTGQPDRQQSSSDPSLRPAQRLVTTFSALRRARVISWHKAW